MKPDEYQNNPMHFAACAGVNSTEILNFFVQQTNQDKLYLDGCNTAGETPLMYVVSYKDVYNVVTIGIYIYIFVDEQQVLEIYSH